MTKQIAPPVRLSNQADEMQLDVIYGYLTRSYWAEGITKARVKKSLDNSLCFGAFSGKRQIAFARVITDKASFAYLADVFVLEPYRGLGISKQLMSEVMRHPELQNLRRFMLCTADAHGLYQQFGFSPATQAQNLMAIHNPDIYREMSA
ncbi:GNAT family N-acetyltransferase [Thalassomonas viridans]|uniref:GNAT family N-acetyltransferase n=1 Tax=Thalassomonas viridans TaxID=137584 RepID=A0AAE9Z6D3_9GAMM|nr:GNAT family N-acetyltransferase [Thalassomonas viridans]WDE05912.1 GNAT family N-acetyltransferase [Thalassomonas viridans]